MNNCRCMCHGQMLTCDPPKFASDYCNECRCRFEKQIEDVRMSDCRSPETERCPHCSSSQFIISPGNIPIRFCRNMICKKSWLPDSCKIEETITIKKALWDEMLEYKYKVDDLYREVFKIHLKRIDEMQERIDKLEGILNV